MISFNLPAPPSANRIWRVGKGRMHKAPEYTAWLDMSLWNIKEQLRDKMPAKPLTGPYAVFITVRPQDKRYRDIDNYAKPIGDFLEYAGLITNDKHVTQLTIVRGRLADRHCVQIQLYSPDQTRPPSQS